MTAPRKSFAQTVGNAPAVLVGILEGGEEVWRRGEALIVLPPIPDDASPALKSALGRRRRATVTGECSCGATFEQGAQSLTMAHMASCDASDSSIRRLMRQDSTG